MPAAADPRRRRDDVSREGWRLRDY